MRPECKIVGGVENPKSIQWIVPTYRKHFKTEFVLINYFRIWFAKYPIPVSSTRNIEFAQKRSVLLLHTNSNSTMTRVAASHHKSVKPGLAQRAALRSGMMQTEVQMLGVEKNPEKFAMNSFNLPETHQN